MNFLYKICQSSKRKHNNSKSSSLTLRRKLERCFRGLRRQTKHVSDESTAKIHWFHRKQGLISTTTSHTTTTTTLCVSCVNPRVDIHCDCVSCLLFAPPLIIPCLTTHQLSLFDMGYLAEVRVEVWTCIILGSKGFPWYKKYSLHSGRIVRIPSICTQCLLTVCKWYPLRDNTRHKSNVFSV